MPSLQCERSAILLLCGLILAPANALYAQGVARQGGEFSLSGTRKGDQTVSRIAIGPTGGYVVWQDNGVDGPGNSFGIAARKLGEDLLPPAKSFRVNSILKGPQENPDVALLKDGGAAIVWQGGRLGGQDIFFRRVTTAGVLTPKTNDLRVSTFERGEQMTPVITCLSNGNLAVAWCSLHQDKALGGVYARILTPRGQFITNPSRVNQFRGNNQRNPAITTLSNGNFVVAWVSENQGVSVVETFRHTNRVHLYARVFDEGGLPLTAEFRVNTRSNLCSTPAVAPWGEQGFTVVWAELSDNRNDNWDICARTFSAAAEPATDTVLVNSTTYGDQFAPRIAQTGPYHMVVWTVLAHDGSREGVFGRVLSEGQVSGPEFVVNTHRSGSQIHPAVAPDGNNGFLVAWSTHLEFSSFDVHAQRYSVIADEPGSGSEVTLVVNQLRNPPRGGVPPLPPTGFAVTVPGITPREALRVSLANTIKGKRLSWNTEVGRTYQVQYSTNFSRWENLGEPRPAAAAADSMVVGNGEKAAFYRVVRLQ